MAAPTGSTRVIDRLLGDETVDSDPAVVEGLLVALLDGVDQPAAVPAPMFVAALVQAVPPAPRPRRRGLKIAVASGALVLAGAGSAAAAASGALPDRLQSAVHAVAGSVGVAVPDGDGGPPSTGGSQDGEGHGRSDEAPGRPEEPGRPEDPGRSDEAPGRPDDPVTGGVGTDGVPPGQADNEHSDPSGLENPNAGGGNPNAGAANAGGNGDPAGNGNGRGHDR